jgi:hypothetical protein
MVLWNDALIVRELAVDQLRHQLDAAETETGLGGRQQNLKWIVAVRKLTRQLEHRFARQYHLDRRRRFGESFCAA